MPDSEKTSILDSTLLVIGGGISGITAAVEAAETGCNVVLIEKLPYLGGRVSRVNEYFPKRCPPWCGLEINFRRIRQNPKIRILTSATIKEITGINGHYQVSIQVKPEMINNKCTACGECVKVCPADRPDEFNYGLSSTKAIYIPHELAFPFKYTIDEDVCLKEDCGKCSEVCVFDAINLKALPSELNLEVTGIIVATGWKPYDARKLGELSFGLHPGIVTNVMMERLGAPDGPTGGIIKNPDSGNIPDRIAFIQCAGSRDQNHLSYCSGVCCSASLKQALYFVDQNTKGEAFIYYIDLRVSGRNEDFLKKVEDHDRIHLIKGKAAKVKPEKEGLAVEVENIQKGIKEKNLFDMVVLATGIVPEELNIKVVHQDKNSFYTEEQQVSGLIPAGCAKKPMDVSSSVKDATGAVLKTFQNGISYYSAPSQ